MPSLRQAAAALKSLQKHTDKTTRMLNTILDDGTAQGLNKQQVDALYRALRTLDLRNDYEVGDMLRIAFKVELDGLRSR